MTLFLSTFVPKNVHYFIWKQAQILETEFKICIPE